MSLPHPGSTVPCAEKNNFECYQPASAVQLMCLDVTSISRGILTVYPHSISCLWLSSLKILGGSGGLAAGFLDP